MKKHPDVVAWEKWKKRTKEVDMRLIMADDPNQDLLFSLDELNEAFIAGRKSMKPNRAKARKGGGGNEQRT